MSVYRTPVELKQEAKTVNWKSLYGWMAWAGLHGLVYKIFNGFLVNWSWDFSIIKYMLLFNLFIWSVVYNSRQTIYHEEKLTEKDSQGYSRAVLYYWYTMPSTFNTKICKLGIWFSINGITYSVLSNLINYNVLSILLLLNLSMIPLVNLIVENCMKRHKW